MPEARIRRHRWAAVAAALLVACGTIGAPGHAELLTQQLDALPATLPQVERDGPWLHVCDDRPEGPQCRYEQTASASNGDELTLTLLPPADGAADPVALFHAPLYVLLPPGLTLVFDGRTAVRVAFRACSPRGCLASVVLTGDTRSNIARANSLTVGITSQGLEEITATFSLKGSAAILRSM